MGKSVHSVLAGAGEVPFGSEVDAVGPATDRSGGARKAMGGRRAGGRWRRPLKMHGRCESKKLT